MKHSSFDATISALGAEMSAIARSYRRYRRLADCGVGITPQMCNRVTNHGDMSTFSKPGSQQSLTTRDRELVSVLEVRMENRDLNLRPLTLQSITLPTLPWAGL